MRFLTALLAAASLTIACGDVHTPGQDVAAPSTTPSAPGAQAKLVVLASSNTDHTLGVTAQLLDARGVGIPNVDVALSIDGGTVTPALAKTDATGTVTAVAIASGTTMLTATTGALTTKVSVIGGATPLSVTLFIGTVTIGTTSPLAASVIGSPIGGAFKYAWTYGDSQSEDSASSSITHTYNRSGTYSASVKVTDGSGRTATAINNAVVNDPVVAPAPTPTPSPAATTLVATVTCTGNAHGTVSPCNVSATYGTTAIASQAITKVDWDWGDGTALQTVNNSPLASHTYAQAGSYIVTATVTATTTDGSKTAPAVTKTISVT